MTPARYALTIRRGSVFRKVFTYKIDGQPVNLTGYGGRAQVRSAVDSPDPPLVNLTVANGGVALGGVAGTITLFISAVVTAAYVWHSGTWDLELVPPAGEAEAFALLEGSVAVVGQVTR